MIKSNLNRLLCLILSLIFLLCPIGCSSPMPGEKAPTDDLRAEFLAGADQVEVTETSVIFPDASGREQVEIVKNPANVAILYASLTTLWYEAGGLASGCIGGSAATELYTEMIGRDITADEGVTVLAASPAPTKWDLETILVSKPDLIIVSTAMKGYATMAPAAEAASIPVIAVEYNDFSDYLKWFKVFCHLTGHTELWESVALAALDEVLQTLASVPDGEAPSVLALFGGAKAYRPKHRAQCWAKC